MPKRDDFTETTKRIAASRVGYGCSFPGCHAITIGASMESEKSISLIGVAAHICAAAPGGKRYDTNMTPDQRKSIENCIWMCQTHARLIDTDDVTYTVDILKQWKKEAEKESSKRLANINFFDDYYRTNGDNLSAITEIFEGLLLDGNYRQLFELLSQYKFGFSEIYNEFILRYRIIYCIYCDRHSLKQYISQYISLPSKDGINQIVRVLISFLMKDELEILLPFIQNEELINFSKHIVNSTFKESMISTSAEHPSYQCKKENYTAINRAITYLLYTNLLFGVKNENSEVISPNDEEFYFKFLSQLFVLMQNTVLNIKFDINAAYVFFINEIEKIKYLDDELQVDLFEKLLQFFIEDEEKFKKIYSNCSETLKKHPSIQTINYIFEMGIGIQIHEEELLNFAETSGDYKALNIYVLKQPKEKARAFLNEHKYLLSKNSLFIQRWHQLFGDAKTLELLDEYREIYSNDFCFNCIDALCGNKEKVFWLITNEASLKSNDLPVYIEALEKHECFNELYQLSSRITDPYIIYRIACSIGNNEGHKKHSKELISSLDQQGFNVSGLLLNLGILQQTSGEVESAKNSFRREYDIHHSNEALYAYLSLRYQTRQFIDDNYLKFGKSIADARIQNVVGATLIKLRNKKAYTYLMRSLLLDAENLPCMNGFWSTYLSDTSPNQVESIGENVVCVLEDIKKETTITVAIHDSTTLEGIAPNTFGNCNHYSIDNPLVSSILFLHVGEETTFNGEKYIIKDITDLTSYLARYCFSKITNSPNVVQIYGETPQKAIEGITDYLKKANEETNELIKKYNEAEIRFPLTSLAGMIGKSMLIIHDFLLNGNTEKIRNNVNLIIPNQENFYILSYDAIVNLFILEMEDILTEKINIVCPSSVKERLISDIDDELADLTSNRETGFASYQNGSLSFTMYNAVTKRERHTFLSRLKTFVNKIPVKQSSDYMSKQLDFSELVSAQHLYCENGCLSLTQSTSNGILITDEQFLYSVASLDGLKNAGLLSFLTLMNYTFPQLLKRCKQLSTMNYSRYFSPTLYDKAVKSLMADSKNFENDSKDFTNFLLTDKDESNDASSHHRELILQVYREICQMDPSFISDGGVLNNIAMHHFVALYPEESKQLFEEQLKNIKIELIYDEEKEGPNDSFLGDN